MNTDVNCLCSHCGQKLSVPGDMVGQTIQCPVCRKDFEVVSSRVAIPPGLPPRTPVALNQANLTLSKEKTYLAFVVMISVAMWLAALMTIFLALIALGLGVVIWFANGLLVAKLKAEAIKIDETQLPSLAATFQDVSRQVGVAPVPELYVVKSG